MVEVLGFARVADEQAIDAAGHQGLHVAHFRLVRLLRLANHNPVAGLGRYLLNAADGGGKKRPLNVRNNDANGVGFAAFEALGQ